jgi:hypothetical protein
MNTAQSAFATLAGVFAVIGALLLERSTNNASTAAGWLLVALAYTGFVMLGWMIIADARARANRQG